MPGMTTTPTPNNQQQGHGGCCSNEAHEEIAKAAFCLYEKQGSQNGNDVRNWLDAEARVKARHVGTGYGGGMTAKSINPSTM